MMLFWSFLLTASQQLLLTLWDEGKRCHFSSKTSTTLTGWRWSWSHVTVRRSEVTLVLSMTMNRRKGGPSFTHWGQLLRKQVQQVSCKCVEDVTGLFGDWNVWFSGDEWTSGGDLLDLLTNQKTFNVEAFYVMSTAHGTLYTHQQTVTHQYIVMEDKQRPCDLDIGVGVRSSMQHFI